MKVKRIGWNAHQHGHCCWCNCRHRSSPEKHRWLDRRMWQAILNVYVYAFLNMPKTIMILFYCGMRCDSMCSVYHRVYPFCHTHLHSYMHTKWCKRRLFYCLGLNFSLFLSSFGGYFGQVHDYYLNVVKSCCCCFDNAIAVNMLLTRCWYFSWCDCKCNVVDAFDFDVL